MKKVFARKQRRAQRPPREIPKNTVAKRLRPYLLELDDRLGCGRSRLATEQRQRDSGRGILSLGSCNSVLVGRFRRPTIWKELIWISHQRRRQESTPWNVSRI